MDKKSIIALICCFILVTVGITSVSYGEENSPKSIRYIKVGLNYPISSDKQINLYSDNGFDIKVLEDDFKNIANIKDTKVTVRLDYHFEDLKKETGSYHIEVTSDFKSYEDVLKMKKIFESGNINVIPVRINGKYRLWIGQYSNEERAIAEVSKLSNKIQNEMTVIESGNKMLVLEDENENPLLLFEAGSSIYISEPDKNVEQSIVGVGDRSYRGYVTFNRVEDEIKGINYINLEKYLYGVVPREMSGSWAMEALKAQAVAARNYALLSIGKHWNEGYDLCDTTHCQVYAGFNWENIRSNKAVDETEGKLLKYEGKLVSTFYHSSSGGRTENSENVWSFPVPYLKGVEDAFSLGSPNSNWKLVLTNEDIMEKLEKNDVYIGEITSIVPIDYSENGRVLKLAINGQEGMHILEKDGARRFLGYNSLKSTMFSTKSDGEVYVMGSQGQTPKKVTLGETSVITAEGIEIANRSSIRRENNYISVYNGKEEKIIPSIPQTYTFDGKGWGHGLGMSQWGAKKMAEEGYNYEEILEHYYTGTKVE